MSICFYITCRRTRDPISPLDRRARDQAAFTVYDVDILRRHFGKLQIPAGTHSSKRRAKLRGVVRVASLLTSCSGQEREIDS